MTNIKKLRYENKTYKRKMTYKFITKLIKKEYDAQGHSVRSLSIKADVARQSVKRILSGEGVTVTTLIAVCGVLGLDVDVKKIEK